MLIKPKIINATVNDARKLCSFPLTTKSIGEYSLSTRLGGDYEFNKIFIEIKNKFNYLLANEEIVLPPGKEPMEGLYLTVDPGYRSAQKNNLRFGEILRLASIIEMLENGKNLFKIYSKNTAVYFHSKYKFEPNMNAVSDANRVLESIIKNKKQGLQEYSLEAERILSFNRPNMSYEERKAYCKAANELTKEYIKKVQSLGKDAYKEYPFDFGMDMVLTKDMLIRKRAVFNDLFKKHSIDYTI